MTSRLNPYLNFDGSSDGGARAAMEFYRDVFGGELVISTFGEYGQQDTPIADQVMHSQLETPAGYTLMASDPPPGMEAATGGSISLSGEAADATDLRGYFAKLADGGTVTVALEKQMWGDEFGSCVDRFGVSWLVNIAQT